MRFFRPVLLFLLVSLATLTFAQAPAQPTRDDVLKFFEIMRVRQSMEDVRTAAVEQAKASVRALISDELPHATAPQVAELEGMVERMIQAYTIDNTIDDLIPIYQRHMSKDDLEAMNSFFSSPAGQKFLDTEPVIANEALQVVNGKTEKQVASSMAAIYNRIDEMKAQSGKAPAAAKKAPAKAAPKKK